MVRPDRGRLATYLIAIPALVGMLYYAAIFLGFAEDSPVHSFGAGMGFWVAWFCLMGYLLQLAFVQPQIHSRVAGRGTTLGSYIPSIPQNFVPYMFLLFPLILYFVWISCLKKN